MTKRLLCAFAVIALLPTLAGAQQLVPGRDVIYRVDGTANAPTNTYDRDKNLGSYRIGADNEGFSAGGTLRWDYNTTRLKLASGYLFDMGSTSFAEADLAKIDGITNGTIAAGKAVVVDSNLDAGTFRHLSLSGNLVTGATTLSETDLAKIDAITNGTPAAEKAWVGDVNSALSIVRTASLRIGTSGAETTVTATGAELNYLAGVTAGTVTASKALVVDANKDLASLRNVTLSGVLTVPVLNGSSNVLEQKSSTLAQIFRVYKSTTDGQRIELVGDDGTGASLIRTNWDSGSGHNLNIGGGGSYWQFNKSGHFLALGANNIGDGAGNSPVNIWAENDMLAGTGGYLGWTGSRSRLYSSTDGNITLRDSAGTSFGALQFGGTTSSFPAWKRNGAAFDARLADESGYASITVSNLTVSGTTFSVPSSGLIYFNSRLRFSSPGDGVATLTDDAQTGFSRLILGPNSASGVALVKDTIFVQLRLGNGSAVSGAVTASLPAAASARDGIIGFDTTLNAFVYYVGGNRYKLVGTSF